MSKEGAKLRRRNQGHRTLTNGLSLAISRIFLAIVILLNLIVGSWLFSDLFDAPDTPSAGTEEIEEEPKTEENTETSTEPPAPTTVELSPDQAKRELLVLYPGEGEGQVGYYEDTNPAGDGHHDGPESFAVIDETIYVLDSVNQRMICCVDNIYTEFKVPKDAVFMQCSDAQIYLVAKESELLRFYVYDLDGTEKLSVALPKTIREVCEVIEVSDTSVKLEFWSAIQHAIMEYDWEIPKSALQGSVPSLIHRINDEVYVEFFSHEVIGEVDGDLFYECYERGTNDRLINRQSADGSRWFVKQELEKYFFSPNQLYYFDADGRFYLMECFDDRTVISELLLGEFN